MPSEHIPGPSELAPEVAEERPKRKKVVIADISEAAEEKARDVAESKLTEAPGDYGLVRRFARRIWTHNLAREYHRQKEITKARQKILEGENIYADETADRSAHEGAMGAIVEQFSSEYEEALHVVRRPDGSVDEEKSEKRETLSESAEEKQFKEKIQGLIRSYAAGTLNDDAFREEKARLLGEELRGLKPDVVDRGKMFADNLFEIAREAKRAVEHGQRLEELDLDFDVVVGRAKAGVRTQAQFNRVDRAIDWMQRSAVGRLVNETTIALGVSLAYSLAAGLSQRLASSRVFALGSFFGTAALSAGIAGARESKRLEEEKRQHFREMAQGKQFSPEAKRRKTLEEFRYETARADALVKTLEESLYNINEKGSREIKDLSQTELEAVLGHLAEIEARISLSDREKIDLISYSNEKNVVKERLELDITRARAKRDIQRILNKEVRRSEPAREFVHTIEGLVSTEEIKSFVKSDAVKNETDEKKKTDAVAYWLMQKRLEKSFTIEDVERVHGSFTPAAAREYAQWDWVRAEEILKAAKESGGGGERVVGQALAIPEGKTLDEFSQGLREARIEQLITGDHGLEAKNRAFKSMKRWKVAGAVAQGLITGAVIGGLAQEGIAFLREGQEGMIEGWIKGRKPPAQTANVTALEYFRRLWGGELKPPAPGDLKDTIVGGVHVKCSSDIDIVKHPDGSMDFVRSQEVLGQGVKLNPDGNLPEDVKNSLAGRGIIASSSLDRITTTTNETVTLKPKEFIEREGLTTRIKRLLWYDNDTPKPIFDKNELKLWWGGVKGTGLDKNGNYVFDIARMAPDGSYHTSSAGQLFSVDAQEAMKAGRLKILLSLSRDTQNHVFEIPIDPSGKAIIDPASEEGKMLFATEKGKALFRGRFAEVAEMMGEKDGKKGVRILATHEGKGLEGVPTTIEREVPKEVPKIFFECPPEEPPPIVEPQPEREYAFEAPPFIPIVGRRPLEPVRERIYPERIYPVYPEVAEAEREALLADMSPRLRANPDTDLDPAVEIPWYFDDQERRHPGYVRELENLDRQVSSPEGRNVEAVVALAVAGHQEHKNVYRALETYAVQRERKSGQNVWKGNESKYEILLYVNWPAGKKADKTLAEVERFKKNYPHVPVHVYTEEITNRKVEVGWYKKKVFDLALLRHKERGAKSDILIVANDADMMYSSPIYLEDVQEAMQSPEGKRYDAILGRQDLDPAVYARNPTFHAAMRFWQFMEAVVRAKHHIVGTQGRNTVMRGSSYAAIGGNRTKDFWADLEIGQLLKTARPGRENIGYLNRIWVMVDPRREINKFKSGERLAWTWSDFNERDNVRGGGKREHDLPEKINVEDLAKAEEESPDVMKFREALQEEIQAIVDVFGPKITTTYAERGTVVARGETDEGAKIIQRAADYLGIRVTISVADQRPQLTITDTSKLRERLRDYRREKREDVKIKTHPLR